MRKISLATLFLCCCVLSASAQTQNAPTTPPGPVWRVTLYKIKPGKGAEMMTDMRQNLRPVWEEQKKQGVIVDYKVYINSTNDGSGDWDLAVAIGYKNWATLDDLGQKTGPISLKHYGTAEKRQEAGDKRMQLREVVSSRLMQEMILNPLP